MAIPGNRDKILEENEKGAKLPQYMAAVSVSIGATAAGCAFIWTATITEDLLNGNFNGLEINDIALSWIGSLPSLGAMCMCLPIGVMCNKLGRKMALLLFIFLFITGWLLIIFAINLTMLYAGRFMTGLAGGAFCVAVPWYTIEIADKDIRGRFGSFFQLFFCGGGVFGCIVSYFLPVEQYTITVATLPILFLVLFACQPETPTFYMTTGKEGKAKASLLRLRGKHYNPERELQEIKTSIEEGKLNSFKESLCKKSTKKATVICFSLMCFQQLSGINAILVYLEEILVNAQIHMDSKVTILILVLISTCPILLSSVIVDKLGRRIVLIISSTIMSIGLAILGVYFTLQEHGKLGEKSGAVPVVGLAIFFVMHSFGLSSIPWMMAAELFPVEIKGIASAIMATFNWFLAFLITKFYLHIKSSIGNDLPFYFFTAVGLLSAIFTYFVVPETTGKSLEQIQKELNA